MDIGKKPPWPGPLPSHPVYADQLPKHFDSAARGVLGFSRQAYYQYWQRQTDQVSYDADILQLVKKVRQDHPRIGGRKLYRMLEKEFLERGIKMGRDGFFELLAANRLLIRGFSGSSPEIILQTSG